MPHDRVWGSRLKSWRALYRFEALSLMPTFAFSGVVLQRAGVRVGLPEVATHYELWLLGIVFVSSTRDNLLPKNNFERWVMVLLALVMGVCALWLARH